MAKNALKKNGKESSPVVEALAHLLADSYTLYLKTHNFHWNVTGPMFQTLHLLFEAQYTELALAVDEIAERIRALGHPAPGSYAEFGKLTRIAEAQGVPPALEMIESLTHAQSLVVEAARRVLAAAETSGDDGTADLAVRRIQVHEKNAWMLRSHLE
jgi:starvation-inducible DNA-binding protein